MERLITLNTGTVMPRLGLGLYSIPDDEVVRAVGDAVSMGYRLFDTASSYKNEELVGEAIRTCGVPRDELFVTTKVWNTAQRMGAAESAFNRSLERLGLDYVDLYLVHWPVPGCYIDTWHVLEDLYKSGRAKAIGVSNFTELELMDLMEHSEIVPAVNQIEYHPLLNQEKLRLFCQTHGIAVQASCPLARGAYLQRNILQMLAEKYNRSTAQIGLRWLVQKDICVIPRTARTDRILENSQIFDFTLEEHEMLAIDEMNEDYHTYHMPEDLQL